MCRAIILTFVCALSTAFAAETPASDASIREILRITEARKLVEGILPQVDAMMKAGMQQGLKGHVPSREEQDAMDRMREKALAMMQEELNWEKLERMYLAIYRKSFSQEEVDGMIVFYKSPAGVAMIKKLPIVMQETMTAMQQLTGPMMRRIEGMVKETIEELEAQKRKAG